MFGIFLNSLKSIFTNNNRKFIVNRLTPCCIFYFSLFFLSVINLSLVFLLDINNSGSYLALISVKYSFKLSYSIGSSSSGILGKELAFSSCLEELGASSLLLISFLFSWLSSSPSLSPLLLLLSLLLKNKLLSLTEFLNKSS